MYLLDALLGLKIIYTLKTVAVGLCLLDYCREIRFFFVMRQRFFMGEKTLIRKDSKMACRPRMGHHMPVFADKLSVTNSCLNGLKTLSGCSFLTYSLSHCVK